MAVLNRMIKVLALLLIICNRPYMPVRNLWADTGVRLKDIGHIHGIRSNQLVGYGLLVGLNGTGDTSATSFTFQSIVSMLERMGITVSKSSVSVKNVAAVIVTADIPSFAKEGTRIDCVVSSLGNASDLQGGTLLMTPLQGPDGQVYAVAQGPVSVGGFDAGSEAGASGGMNIKKNFPTVGRVPYGASIEKEIPTDFVIEDALSIVLTQPDFTTCDRVARAINDALGKKDSAIAQDAAVVKVMIPEEYRDNVIKLVAILENVKVLPDMVARVVINERTGTIVAGSHVRISTVAVAHGNLSIEVKSRYKISQPNPLSRTGTTSTVSETEATVEEENARLLIVNDGVDIAEVANALNSLGVTPRDMISIFQAIKESGALQAELRIM
jgi:flagellar P-ring protein precursor FlgI